MTKAFLLIPVVYVLANAVFPDYLVCTAAAAKAALVLTALATWISVNLPDAAEMRTLPRPHGLRQRWDWWWSRPYSMGFSTRCTYLVTGVVAALWARGALGPPARLLTRGAAATATVAAVEECPSDAPVHLIWTRDLCMTYSFVSARAPAPVQGEEHVPPAFRDGHPVGARVRVRYLPEDPSVNDVPAVHPWKGAAVAAGLFMVGFFFLFWLADELRCRRARAARKRASPRRLEPT